MFKSEDVGMVIHWTAARKADVVRSVHRGDLSMKEACLLHGISEEEFRDWAMRLRGGEQALRVTRRTAS